MNKLSEEEFKDRMGAIQRARRIFIEPGLTNNITTAFRIYQEVFAEREREIFINTFVHGDRSRTFMDNYERLSCIDCGFDMLFRQARDNQEDIKIQLVCSNHKCDMVLNSKNDLQWWMENLRKKDESEPAKVS